MTFSLSDSSMEPLNLAVSFIRQQHDFRKANQLLEMDILRLPELLLNLNKLRIPVERDL